MLFTYFHQNWILLQKDIFRLNWTQHLLHQNFLRFVLYRLLLRKKLKWNWLDYRNPRTTAIVPICGDFKVRLNLYIEIDQDAGPRIEELFVKLQRETHFTKLDLQNAHQQICLDDASKDLVTIQPTAVYIVIPEQHLEFQVFPQNFKD